MTIILTPTLNLDFESGVIDPRITFSRALSTATRVNQNGGIENVSQNTPRFNYDSVTKKVIGLLVEEQRQNLVTYSQNSAFWAFDNTFASTSAIALDGTTSAQVAFESGTTSTHFLRGTTASVTLGSTYTGSYFVKRSGRDFVQLTFSTTPFGSGQYANFDLSTGAVVNQVGGVAEIQPFKDGWYRVCFSAVCTTTGTAAILAVFSNTANPSRLPSYAGDITKGLVVWGNQIELGSFATSYIPTTTTALTRNADVATITGTNFSSFWQTTRGGVLVRARPGTVSGTRPWLQFDDGTANEIIALRGNTTNPELYIVDGGVMQAQIDAGTIAANTDYSMTGWWATNDCKARLGGGAVVTDTSATIPTVTQARLGSDGTDYLNGHLASISYYDVFSQQIYTRRKNKAVFSLL